MRTLGTFALYIHPGDPHSMPLWSTSVADTTSVAITVSPAARAFSATNSIITGEMSVASTNSMDRPV